jgi:hypothetical protein
LIFRIRIKSITTHKTATLIIDVTTYFIVNTYIL